MYDIIKEVILSRRYELTEILRKIDTVWIQGDLTEEQKNELVKIAQENAIPDNTYKPLQEQIDLAFMEIKALKEEVAKLKGEEPVDPEEYPPYKQPSGAHDAYNTGDKVTFNGKRYICKMDGCVWDPVSYPQAWDEVK